MEFSAVRWVLAALLLAATLVLMECGTIASAIVPPTVDQVTALIIEHDRPLGVQSVTAVENVSIGGFDAGNGTWTVQADVQHVGVLSTRQCYLVYRDTEGRWAIRRR
ncbi:hypothetical protein JXD38_05780 [candidate division WOR-3 bacterium]|nr:hypothetical protein [candidate division WOR-3 bacterium]